MTETIRNFTFKNPTKILFGKNRIEDIDNEIPKDAKVLVLYGGGSVKTNGSLQRTIDALGNREYSEFSGIEPNPTYETLMKAVKRVKEEKFTFLMAVGGGSVIDGVKFVAAASLFDGEPYDMFGGGIGKALPVLNAVPFGTVLTLPATGSEMNAGAVITFVEKQAKISFGSVHTYPQFSVLEPELTYSLPKRQLVNGILDSFIHTIENYLTYPVGALVQDHYSEGLLKTIIQIAPTVIDENNHDYNARANFMWAATNALNGTLSLGVPTDWSTHALGHEITLNHDIDHGRTLSIVLPAMMKARKAQKFDKLVQYGKNVFNLQGTDEEIATGAIEKTEQFFTSLGAPIRFKDVNLDETVIDALVAGLVRHEKMNITEHRNLTAEEAKAIYQLAL